MSKQPRRFSYDDLTRTAFEITRRETAERAAKTAKLRALRLEREAAAPVEEKARRVPLSKQPQEKKERRGH
jgi:hypothetical protein